MQADRLTRFRAPAAIFAGAGALWLWIGTGFPNYDTLYSLVWGQQLSRGQLPVYDLPIAPTPHPLVELLGVVLSPLSPTSEGHLVVVVAYLLLATLAYLVYRLGATWFSPAVGAVAAGLVITREPILSYGIRAYVDVPYLCLVLCALLVETRRPRAGAVVLWLLVAAGLLRPEAWLLSGFYWLYMWRDSTPSQRVRLALIVACAPLLWVLSDLLVTGNPLWSLTKTKSTAKTLGRTTGLLHVPLTGSERIGEILRPDGLLAAGIGGALSLWLLRSRAIIGAVAGIAAVLTLAIVSSPGLPINTRYAFLAATILAIYAGAGAFGWLNLPKDHPRRRLWQAGSVVIAVGFVALIPSQRSRLESTFHNLAGQQRISDDLLRLVDNHTISLRCGKIATSNHQPVPLLALHLHTSPTNIVSLADASPGTFTHGIYVEPATSDQTTLEKYYALDPLDPTRIVAMPNGFHLAARDSDWLVFASC
jgi:hypothetical protein